MSVKSANVVARIEPHIKEQAEAILSEMGITASVGINIFYHQIIRDHGLPFKPTVQPRRPKSFDEMTDEEFDGRMSEGLAQAKAGMGSPVDEVFAKLRERNKNGREAV